MCVISLVLCVCFFCPFYSFLFCFFLFFSGKQQTNNRIRIYSDRRVRRKKTRASWQIGSFSLHCNGKKCVICFGRDVLRVQIVEPVFRCSVLLSIYKLIFFSAFSFFFLVKNSLALRCAHLYIIPYYILVGIQETCVSKFFLAGTRGTLHVNSILFSTVPQCCCCFFFSFVLFCLILCAHQFCSFFFYAGFIVCVLPFHTHVESCAWIDTRSLPVSKRAVEKECMYAHGTYILFIFRIDWIVSTLSLCIRSKDPCGFIAKYHFSSENKNNAFASIVLAVFGDII